MLRKDKHCPFYRTLCSDEGGVNPSGFNVFSLTTRMVKSLRYSLDNLLKTGANIGDFLFPYTVYRK